jgi:hypothetical protein
MTRLQLLQALWLEAGASGDEPTSSESQTGETGRLVSWNDNAYYRIQALHYDWDFLRDDFSFTTTDGTQTYTPAAAGASELGNWKTDDVRLYSSVNDEAWIDFTPWDEFRRIYLFGSARALERRPVAFSIKPNNSIILGHTPNDEYTVNGEYWKRPQTMTADDDEPLIPDQFQWVIVWRALMFYGVYEGADELYSHGEKEYLRALSELELDQHPLPGLSEPLV